MRTVIEKLKLKDVAIITLENDSGYAGLGVDFRINAAKMVYVGDVMDDIRSAIKAMGIDKVKGMEIFDREFQKICSAMDKSSKVGFWKQLKLSAKELSKIKLVRPISDAKYIGVVGEIFVRRDHFSLMGIPERLAKNGFVMLDAHVTEWTRYVDFLQEIRMFETKTNFIGKIEGFIATLIQDRIEKKVKKIFATTGLYEVELINIKEYMKHSTHLFSLTLTGEPGLSTGASLYHLVDKYCGVINVGPFGCMNSSITEAVTTSYMNIEGKMKATKVWGQQGLPISKSNLDVLPFLSIECDGNPFSQILEARFETFMLQAERLYQEMMKRKKKK